MQHVSSLGGPRVMLPSSDVTRWINELGDSPTPNAGLYKLACSVDDYCGIISPWGKPLLVFGDDPSDIYYSPHGQHSLFFRWVGADSLEQLSAFAFDVASSDCWDETTSLIVTDSDMTVMDACTYAGDSSPRINVNLQTGSYTMHSRYAETSNVMTIVHCLKYVESIG